MVASTPGAQVEMNTGVYQCQAICKPQVSEATAASVDRGKRPGSGPAACRHLEVGVMGGGFKNLSAHAVGKIWANHGKALEDDLRQGPLTGRSCRAIWQIRGKSRKLGQDTSL